MSAITVTTGHARRTDFVHMLEKLEALFTKANIVSRSEHRFIAEYADTVYDVRGTFQMAAHADLMAGIVQSIVLTDRTPLHIGVDQIGTFTSVRFDLERLAALASTESDDPTAVETFLLNQNWRYEAGRVSTNAPPGAPWGDGARFNPRGDDYFELSPDVDSFFSGGGDDVVLGGQRSDTIFAGRGADRVFGESGHDRLFGGAGRDAISGGDGDDRMFGGTMDDFLNGKGGRDHIVGGSGQDWLKGGGDDDRLIGGKGIDWIFGHRGDDALWGGSEADWLRGDSGDDVLFGGPGNDDLYGGGGADRFVILDNEGRDNIRDMSEADVIDLRFHTAVATFDEVLAGASFAKDAFALRLGSSLIRVTHEPDFMFDPEDVLL